MTTTTERTTTLGERIKRHRRRAGLSQAQLAQKLDVSYQAVRKWEQGSAQPRIRNLIAMARVFGIDAMELYQSADTSNLSDRAAEIGLLYDELPTDAKSWIDYTVRRVAEVYRAEEGSKKGVTNSEFWGTNIPFAGLDSGISGALAWDRMAPPMDINRS